MQPPRSMFRHCIRAFVASACLASAIAAPGDLDTAFRPFLEATGLPGVHALAVAPDGKILLGGSFDFLEGLFRGNLGRLDATGAIDPSFATYANASVSCIALQHDGRIAFGGLFTNVADTPREHLARVGPDGADDPGFLPGTNLHVASVAFDGAGRIVLGGSFTNVGGTVRNRLARLNPDGTLDSQLRPAIAGGAGSVYATALQPDGRLLVGGDFATVGGVARPWLARLNADGSLDAAFQPALNGSVGCIAIAADGAIVIGGAFTSAGGNPRPHLARLHPDGSLDAGFSPSVNNFVSSLAIQADGRILLGGYFTSIDGVARSRIARLQANGALDTAFHPGANGRVAAIALQADGKILLGGFFTAVNGVLRTGIARLENDTATQSLAVPSRNRVVWLRSGASPEARDVLFELSTTGGNTWTPLGAARRIAGGWDLDGLDLPASGLVRARARVSGGEGGGSSGIVEAARTYPSLLESWRVAKFGTAADNLAISGDDADPDGDGRANLLEYFLSSEPLGANDPPMPFTEAVAGHLTLTFTRDTGHLDINATVQAADALGAWGDLAGTFAGGDVVPLTPGVGITEQGTGSLRTVTITDPVSIDDPSHRRRFLRLKVTR